MTNIFGIFLSLFSAITWGGGDFLGGISTRKHPPFSVLAVSAFSGIMGLLACHLFWSESFPTGSSLLFAMLAGASGIFGLGALYTGLSTGHAAIVAPTSAVIGAMLPVLYSSLIYGFPGIWKGIGFLLAFIGIWLTTFVGDGRDPYMRKHIILAVIAGLGFGLFFIFISLASVQQTITPLIISRSTFFVIASMLLVVKKEKIGTTPTNPMVWMTGILDAAGNALFILAKQTIRVDIAVVISSLYPASTVVLSNWILHEKIGKTQWIGVACCVIAVMIIST